MTDRETLELAAKAAGLWDAENNCVDIPWDPLNNDGDALRLAVKLNLCISIEAESAGVITVEWDFEEGISKAHVENPAPIGGDDYAATRRAIARAAAEIGRRMKS